MHPDHLAELRILQSSRRLAGADRARYEELVAELLAQALEEENARLRGAQQRRRSVRMRRAVPVELSWGPHVHRALTLDLGAGGLAALLAVAPPRDLAVSVKLQLSSRETFTATARVVSSQTRTRGTWRVSLAFVALAQADRAKLEACLAGDALSQASLTSARAAAPLRTGT